MIVNMGPIFGNFKVGEPFVIVNIRPTFRNCDRWDPPLTNYSVKLIIFVILRFL